MLCKDWTRDPWFAPLEELAIRGPPAAPSASETPLGRRESCGTPLKWPICSVSESPWTARRLEGSVSEHAVSRAVISEVTSLGGSVLGERGKEMKIKDLC